MFAFGLKGRTAEVIKRATYALFLGDFIDKEMIHESELNEEAQAGLYFHVASNCLYDLYLQMKMSQCGDDAWATIGFFMESTLDGIERFEREHQMTKGSLATHCITILAQIGGYAVARGVYPDLMSAREVEKLDNDTNVEEAQKFIVAARDKFHEATEHMFT